MFDKKKIEEGIRLLLEGIGENPDREGLRILRTVWQECMKNCVAV